MKYPTFIVSLLLPIALQSLSTLRAQEDSLGRYLSVAAAAHPAIAAARLAGEASLEKLPQAGAYADPALEVGGFISPMEYAGGRLAAQFQLMQMFPWFGTRKAARTEAQHIANMAFEALRQTRNTVFLEIYTQWYALCALRHQLLYSETTLRQTEQTERLAMAADATQGLLEVVNIQLEKMEMENRIKNLRAEIKAGKALFNALLNRPPESPVVLPDTLIRIPFLPDAETLRQEIIERNPMLGMLREETLAYKAKAEMNRKMGYPMWGAGLQYMLMTPLEGAMPNMNGKDMIMPMIALTIPIYQHKYRAAGKESLLLSRAGEAKLADAVNSLEAGLHRALYRLDEAERNLDLYSQQTQLVRSAGNLTTQAFVSGRADLNSVIRIQRQLLDLQLKTAEATAAYNTGVATILHMISSLTPE